MPTDEQRDRPAPPTTSWYELKARELVVLAASMTLLWLVVSRDGVAPERPADQPAQSERAVVQRVEWKASDGQWVVWDRSVATELQRARVAQTHKRHCLRRSPTHRCRVVVEAVFDTVSAAHAYRRSRCQTHDEDESTC
ncbi:hypothetical protein [Cryptosporangium aurantiacum]|uniref:Uncharacterized protein n=1 Tax=Cryptosporangium aurantiacum TaxID=134849 RepID=A0A1M7RP86_9ACTN|nr:hypothetical protein [Cryptosporangium aurantiacum]SHN48064.1 hypothetical protein SAMN05443668_13311 [Cryptosporangium aurantiacum]